MGGGRRSDIHPGRQAVIWRPHTHFLLYARPMGGTDYTNKLNQKLAIPRFKSYINFVLTVGPWANDLSSLNLGLHICKNSP